MKSVEYYETVWPYGEGDGLLKRLMARIGQYISDVSQRSALRAEFMELDHRGGLDSVLLDIGLTRPELFQMIGAYPVSGRLLPRMASRLGIDLDKVDPKSRYQIGRSCSLCQSRRTCHRWLDRPGTDLADYHCFCPNAEVFDAILRGPANESAPEPSVRKSAS